MIPAPLAIRSGFDTALGSWAIGTVDALGRNAWWWYWSWGTDSFPAIPSSKELSGEPSCELSAQSDDSLTPDTELALVVAEDSTEVCCGVVLTVDPVSRLCRCSSRAWSTSLVLESSGSGVAEPFADRGLGKPKAKLEDGKLGLR